VYKKRGKRWVSYLWATTGINGKYSVEGLAPGEYKVKFSFAGDENGPVKYYKKGSSGGAKKRSGGTAVKVRSGGTTNGINIRY
jgi:ABC-type proline/glycine betaine transport system substrate-binding protein